MKKNINNFIESISGIFLLITFLLGLYFVSGLVVYIATEISTLLGLSLVIFLLGGYGYYLRK